MLISKFSNTGHINDIEVLEYRYNIRFPLQYKRFLIKYNGGYTPKTKFKLKGIESDLQGFYGAGEVNLSFDNINLSEWIRHGLFPIAFDSFGNHIVINLENENVYFCDHEEGNRLTFLTEDIECFFAYCQSKKINEAAKRSIEEREKILRANGKGAIINDTLRKLWQAEIDKYSSIIQEEVVLD